MTTRTKIKEVFSKLLSPKVEILNTEPHEEDLDIELETFLSMIQSWKNAWKQQNTLFNKYGLDFSGYDNLLYLSIEKCIILLFGPIKYPIIAQFVYSDINFEEDALKIVDNNDKAYYIHSPEELFEFLLNVEDEDLIFEDNESEGEN